MSAFGPTRRDDHKLSLIDIVLRDKSPEQLKKLINTGVSVDDIFIPGIDGEKTDLRCKQRVATHSL